MNTHPYRNPLLKKLHFRAWWLFAVLGPLMFSCKVSVPAKHDGKAAYHDLLTHGGDSVAVAQRYLGLENTVNFRDLGGLKTKEGRTVRKGMIYRSDNLSKLETKQFDQFNALRIASVYDLRTDHEIEGKEDHLPSNVRYRHTPVVEDNAGEIKGLKKRVLNGEITEQQAMDMTAKFYADAVTVHVGAVKAILNDITASDQPVLYHCSAGKDRTGIVSALILSILNVDRQLIVDDYMLSNYYRRNRAEKTLGKAKLGRIIKPKLNMDAIEILSTVDESFIRATFNAIDSAYGGIDPFIENQLGIDQATRVKLVAKFTE
ncbi:tyrosine-protein phosphatase [Dyadobacter jiangsuensis]|uniref:Protein-tyrosine phosphatase n=1 Tax=Dyadobacter jiangsuensis TaxID=1591085 RepID=A0A2P8GBS7_9BACT|nr:tyrosine-protein phosphatase [Dyadobacter jiangsuensis]PSL31345.1 protein-tyrosine phosphatase [Dyadobacter jiangsuensis]